MTTNCELGFVDKLDSPIRQNLVQGSCYGGYLGSILMEDTERAFFEPFLVAIRGHSWPWRPPCIGSPQCFGAVFWIARTGSPWRDLPDEFGKWSSVYRQFRRWTLAGLWEMILEVLNESGVMPDQVQMIDSTVIRARHFAAGAKALSTTASSRLPGNRGLKKKVLAAQKVALRPRSTSLPTLTDCLSGRK